MPIELAFLMQKFSSIPFSTIIVEHFNFRVYQYKNTHVLIAYTGIGTSFAASVFTLINLHFRPKYFFIVGTAGGIKPHLKLRDVVIAESACETEIQDLFQM